MLHIVFAFFPYRYKLLINNSMQLKTAGAGALSIRTGAVRKRNRPHFSKSSDQGG